MTLKSMKTYNIQDIENTTLNYFNGDVLARDVWIKKYCLKDEKNYYELSPDDMHRRIAEELARIESKYPNSLDAAEIFETIKGFKRIVPQGSPMSGIGNKFQVVSLANCFVVGNYGESDSYGGILNTDQEQVQLMKRRGGVGHDLSHIRPSGSPVKNSAITSTGIVPFMERYSNSTREVAQDGRRGALMLSVSIKHPDSEEFIDAKMEKGKVTGANVSVKITNDFMKSVINKTPFLQQYPINKKLFGNVDYFSGKYGERFSDGIGVYQKVDANKIWKKIIHNAWKSAEPGILFWDKVISESIPSCYGEEWKEKSTNPCLTDNAIIMTKGGPIKIKNLIGQKFDAYVDGELHSSTKDGFFETGENRDVFEIKTKRGLVVESTDNHEYKQVISESRNKKNVKWTELKDLQEGDKININNNRGVEWNGNGNFEEGWLIGSLIGDGTFNENTAILSYWGDRRVELKETAIKFIKNNLNFRNDLGTGDNNKDVLIIKSVGLYELAHKFGVTSEKILNDKIENSSSEFHRGFVSGFLDADGTVLDNIEKGVNVRLAQSNLPNLLIVQKMLLRLGVFPTIYENRRCSGYHKLPDGKGGHRNYKIKSQHELVISKDNLNVFSDVINFIDSDKKNKLLVALNKLVKRGLYKEKFIDTIKSIRYIGKNTVYDCQIPGINEFDANGISTHNCGELPLPPYDSCRLLAINLYGYVENPFTAEAKFNTELFRKDVVIGMRYMDDIIDLELEKIDAIINKIDSDRESDELKRVERNLWVKIRRKTEIGRRTGLGVTAEGDMLAALGLIYGTDDANKFAEKVHYELKINAFKSSVIMAKERGAFSIYDSKKEENNPFILRIKETDPELYDDMVLYGRRNIALLTIAPTGSVSIMTQTSSGIEPVFLPVYKRRRKINPYEKDVRVDFIDDEGVSWTEYQVFHKKFEIWLEINGYDIDVVKSMNSEQVDEIVKKSPYYKATSNDVNWLKKVEMQGMVQRHIDHSISVTVNLPEDTTEEIVGAVYEAGWRNGCKGITVYRDGSRSGVLIGESDNEAPVSVENHAAKRPKRLKGEIHRFQNNLEKWIAVVGINDGRPYEIFTGKLENGLSNLPPSIENCEVVRNIIEVEEIDDETNELVIIKRKRYDIEYIDSNGVKQSHTGINHAFNPEYWNYAKLFSGVLRHGMPIVSVYELINSMNLNSDNLNTWKNGVARVIKRFIKNGEAGKGKCPQCGSESLEFLEGCLTCKSCGYSRCS